MEKLGAKLALQSTVFVIVLSIGTLLRAQTASGAPTAALDVCNKGRVPAVVVTEMKYADFLERGAGVLSMSTLRTA